VIAPYIIAAVALPLLVSLIISVWCRDEDADFNVYVLGGRDMPRHHYIATLTASNAALANILFLYVYWGYVYGIWAWLWGSAFWAAGFWLFSRVAKHPRFAELPAGSRPESGFNELMGSEYQSTAITVVCGLISGLAFLFLLTLELNVGAKIFSGLAPAPNATGAYVLAIIIGSVVAAYAGYGGMKAVLKTDVVQLALILLASAALILLVGRLLPVQSIRELIAQSATSTPFFAPTWNYIPFVVGSLFSWSFWFLCTMDMWQRTIATRIERPVLGLKAILPSFLMLVFVTFSGVLVGIFVKKGLGSPFPPKYPLVDFLHSAFVAA
jgi:Na+/proline symporter